MAAITKHKMFIKYIFIALSSFLIDILFFNVFLFFTRNFATKIIISTICARIISSIYNYLLNKNVVFKCNCNNKITISKYYLLVECQMLLSALLVHLIYKRLMFNENFIKIPVDLLIFVVNYYIQKHFVFKRKEGDNNEK